LSCRIVSKIKAKMLVLHFKSEKHFQTLCLIRHYFPSTDGGSSNYLWSADITGIPPPPRRAGCTLGSNLDCAGVSLSTVRFIAKQSTTDCFMAKLYRSSPSMPSFFRMPVTHPRQSPRTYQCRCRSSRLDS
jgi:hypothetical protein